MSVMVRGIRGATTVSENDAQEIWRATRELFEKMVDENEVDIDDIANIHVTVTQDLNATFPAKAISNEEKWKWIPLLCSNEITVPNGLARCIRLMMLVNTEKKITEMKHIFLREAVALRPDLVESSIDRLNEFK